MRELNLRFSAQVTETIELAMRSGQAAADLEPAIVRDMLFGGLEHLALRTIFAGHPPDIEREAAVYVDRLMRGLLPRGSGSDMDSELGRLARLLDRMDQRLDR